MYGFCVYIYRVVENHIFGARKYTTVVFTYKNIPYREKPLSFHSFTYAYDLADMTLNCSLYMPSTRRFAGN